MPPDTAHETGRTHGGGAGRLPLGLTLVGGAVAAAVLLPVVWLVLLASDVGSERVASLLTRPATVQVFVNSLLLVVAVTAASVLLAVPLAYLTVRTDLPFRRFFTVAIALPLVVPSYIGAFAFVSAFGPRGELADLLAPLGVESLPEIYGFHGAVLVLTLFTYPYVYITTRAALKSLDTTLVDAARTLEHTRWETFKRVTLPRIRPAVAAGALLVALYARTRIRPAVAAGALLVALYALSDFGTPAIMRFDAFTRVIYVEYRVGRDLPALLSLQLVAVTTLILAVESRVRTDDTLHSRQASRGGLVRLGRWRWPAVAYCGLVALLGLGVPIAILVMWLFRGGSAYGGVYAFEWGYAWNSIQVSLAAAVAATVLGLPVAYLSARYRSRLAGLFERVTYVGYAVPGVVMGLALVYFGATYSPELLYQSLPLLVFAYVVRFLPQAVGSTRASFLQVDPQLPEAARTLGRSSVGAFRAVTLPLVAPGLLGGAALVFLTTMKELPATLFLRPTGFDTLVTHIWQVQAAGEYGYAAIPALILVAVSALSMLVIISQEGYDVK